MHFTFLFLIRWLESLRGLHYIAGRKVLKTGGFATFELSITPDFRWRTVVKIDLSFDISNLEVTPTSKCANRSKKVFSNGKCLQQRRPQTLGIYSDLGCFWKLGIACLLVGNILLNFGFKLLLFRLAYKNGPLKTNPLNWMILIYELEKLIGVIALTSRGLYFTSIPVSSLKLYFS